MWVSSIETLALKGRRRLNTTLPAHTEWTWVLVGEPTVRQQGQEEFDEELTTLPLKPNEGVWERCNDLEPRLSQLGMLEAIALHTALAAAPWRPRACSF